MLRGVTEEDDLRRFGAAVKATRKSTFGWSVARAAREAGIDRVTWRRVEDGRKVQDITLAAVERTVGFTFEQLTDAPATMPDSVQLASDTDLLNELLRRATARQRSA